MSAHSPLNPPLVELFGNFTRLEPLGEVHKEGLRLACEADQEIWTLYPINMVGPAFDQWWTSTIQRKQAGATLPYAVILGSKVVGCSLLTPDAPNRTAEIGNTYLGPEVRGGAVNPDCKHTLLSHAFISGALCVRFRVDGLNARSRAAVLKLGAHQDGILRSDRITWTGRVRDTVIFSILAEDWPRVAERLQDRIKGLSVPVPATAPGSSPT